MDKAILPGENSWFKTLRRHYMLLTATLTMAAILGWGHTHLVPSAVLVIAAIAALALILAIIQLLFGFRSASKAAGEPVFVPATTLVDRTLATIAYWIKKRPTIVEQVPSLKAAATEAAGLGAAELADLVRSKAVKLAQGRREMALYGGLLAWCATLLAAVWLSRP